MAELKLSSKIWLLQYHKISILLFFLSIFRYYADHVSGFVADVSYEGTAIVVGPPIPAPGYGAPSPSPRPSPRPPLPPPSVTPGYGPPSPAYDGLDY